MATCAVSSANLTNGQELSVELMSTVYKGEDITMFLGAPVFSTMVSDEIVLDKNPFATWDKV